jgi:cephalosporin-C deacetylase
MPQIDLPLDELYQYAGRNPRPADFDEFWDRGLADIAALDPEIEFIPANFKAEGVYCFHLWFTGTGGSRVHAKLLRPATIVGKAPAVLQFHGYSGNSGDWNDKLGFVSQGFIVAALDCRGQGGLSQDTIPVKGTTLNGHIIRGLDDSPEKMYYRNVFLDTALLARIVMDLPQVDEERVVATGGSQGGGLTLACAALEPRIRRAAPWFPFLCDYLRVWEMDHDVAAYEELRKFFRFHDPRHERKDAIFKQLGYIDVQHLAPRIKAEVLMSTGLMDTICPPSTQFAAFNKIQSKKEVVIYPDFGHEGLPGFGDIVFQFLNGV